MNLFLSTILLVGGLITPARTNFDPQPRNDQELILLRTRTIKVAQAEILDFDSQDSGKRFIVHFDHRITTADRELLLSAGFKIEGYLPNSAFLIKGDATIAKQLYSKGIIDYYGPYMSRDKLDPALFDDREDDRVEIMLFPGEDLAEVTSRLIDLGARILRATRNSYNGKILAILDTPGLLEAAEIEGIRWIEPFYEVELFNTDAQWVIQTWEHNQRNIWDKGLHGEGVLGSICDSGLRCDHEMFGDSTVDINTWGDYPQHRKVVAYKPTNSDVTFGDSGGFISYHGTHTTGTVCGDDSYWDGISPHDGMAPKSRIYFMDFDGYSYGITNDYRDMYTPPYQGNAAGKPKFMSNSWGQGAGYNSHAWESDQFMWEHPEFLLIFAAGNSSSYVNAPGTAKNLLTVGASDNGTGADVPAGFSGSGPTADGRIKPDLMAPGVGIHSAHGGTTDGYQSLDGTSMACPVVAGATALVVQYLREGYYPSGEPNPADSTEPSAAMLKALLLASTDTDFYLMPIPHSKIGWGRVDLDSVLHFAGEERKLYLHQKDGGLETGDLLTYQIEVNSNTLPLRVTLVWTDPPPELSASKQLVNDLDLEVHSPSGQVYLGNNFEDNFSKRYGEADELNVVEMVRIERPAQGAWSVRIKGTEIPEGPQPYALVVTGELEYYNVNLTSAGKFIDDSESLEPNGGLDPGETVQFYPVVANTGTRQALDVTGTLSTDEPEINIVTNPADYGDIAPGEESQGQGFKVQASTALEDDQVVRFTLELEANQGAYLKTLEYPVTMGLGVDEEPSKDILSLEVMQVSTGNNIEVSFDLPEKTRVKMVVYDVSGREIRTLLEKPTLARGTHSYTFSSTDQHGNRLSSGVYFVKLITPERELICKNLQLR